MNLRRKVLILACCWFNLLMCMDEKILIITHAHSRPDMIDLHIKTFNAFLEDEYEYVVFNDAPNATLERQISETCNRHGVRCIRVPQSMHVNNAPGYRHMDGLRYSLEQVGFHHNGIVLIIDSDMFLVKPLNIKSFVGDNHLVALKQWRENETTYVTYISPALVFINMATAPNKHTINFNGGYIEGLACDVGAHFYYYFKNNSDLRYRFFSGEATMRLPRNEELLQKLGYDEREIKFVLNLDPQFIFEFYGDNYFMHYFSGGSNWREHSADYIAQKDRIFHNYVDNQIAFYNKNK